MNKQEQEKRDNIVLTIIFSFAAVIAAVSILRTAGNLPMPERTNQAAHENAFRQAVIEQQQIGQENDNSKKTMEKRY